MVPGAPADLFFAQGNQNKFIAMVPSQNLVAVWRDGPNLTDEQRAAALEKLSSPPQAPPPPLVSNLVVASGEPSMVRSGVGTKYVYRSDV